MSFYVKRDTRGTTSAVTRKACASRPNHKMYRKKKTIEHENQLLRYIF